MIDFTCLLDYLNEDLDLADQLAEEALYVHYVEVFPDTREVLSTLHNHVRTAVISNAFPSLSQALERLELTPYLDHVINSSLVDAWKPDERIYHIALERVGVPARNSNIRRRPGRKRCLGRRSRDHGFARGSLGQVHPDSVPTHHRSTPGRGHGQGDIEDFIEKRASRRCG